MVMLLLLLLMMMMMIMRMNNDHDCFYFPTLCKACLSACGGREGGRHATPGMLGAELPSSLFPTRHAVVRHMPSGWYAG